MGYNMEINENNFLRNCLSRAAIEVFATIAGLDFSQATASIPQQPVPADRLTGAMLVHGERNALLSITISKEDAAAIVSSMTGVGQAGLSADDLYDGVAEMINIVAGRAKALLAGSGYHYALTAPFTIAGANHFIVYKKQTSQIGLCFAAGEMVVWLRLAHM